MNIKSDRNEADEKGCYIKCKSLSGLVIDTRKSIKYINCSI